MKHPKRVVVMAMAVMTVALISCATKSKTIALDKHDKSLYMAVPHSPDVFLIMYDAAVGKAPVMQAIKDYGVEIIYNYGSINGMALRKPKNRTLEETMELFRKVKGVVTVEYDHIYKIDDPVAHPRLTDKGNGF